MTNLTRCFTVFVAVIAVLCGAVALPGYAADAKTSLIIDEIRSVVAAIEKPSAVPVERYEAYLRLAGLLQLSLDIEGAAAAWKNAAYSIPKKRDDRALVNAATCYISMGNWEEARSIVKLLLLTVRDDTEILKKTVYLNAQMEAFDSGGLDALYAIAVNPEYIEFRPAIYYTLWLVGGKIEYKARLLAEFPDSPEAGMTDSSKFVSVAPSAYWLLFPGRESVPLR